MDDVQLEDLKVIRRALSKLLWSQDHKGEIGRGDTARIYGRVIREVRKRESQQ